MLLMVLKKMGYIFKRITVKVANGKKVEMSYDTRCAASTRIKVQNGKIKLSGVETKRNVDFGVVNGTLEIGNSFFNRNCIVACRKEIKIMDKCMFGPNVVIYDHDHSFSQNGVKCDEYTTAPVCIESGCWIGANVVILKGTHIGQGSVIGAGTVLKGIIPPMSIVYNDRPLIINNIR